MLTNTLELQKKRFYSLVEPSHPNEWEVDDIFDHLDLISDKQRESLLDYVPAVWPVSHSLCFAYLLSGAKAVAVLPQELLGDWVRAILDLYEEKGLLGARRFMEDVEESFLTARAGLSVVTFSQIAPLMGHYLLGISGSLHLLQRSDVPYTDTQTVYLPLEIDAFDDQVENRLLYKLILSLQWAHIVSGIFGKVVNLNSAESLEKDADCDDWVFGGYGNPQLAKDAFAVVMFIKSYFFLKQTLPGLARKAAPLCSMLITRMKSRSNKKSVGVFFSSMLLLSLAGDDGVAQAGGRQFSDESALLCEQIKTSNPLDILDEVYDRAAHYKSAYRFGALRLLIGEFRFHQAEQVVVRRRIEERGKFVALLSGVLAENGADDGEQQRTADQGESLHDALLAIISSPDNDNTSTKHYQIELGKRSIEIPEELRLLAAKIHDDLGDLPLAYVQATAGIGGGGVQVEETASGVADLNGNSIYVPSAVLYDEWDYRRGGYRKQWCGLIEKTLEPVLSSFVDKTLEKYRSQLLRLRRQFEMLHTRERFLRRRRHGDEIDIDALIEALGDSRAGLSPSDRLFIRLLRDERDISTMFLVDMSNSTEGWVGIAIREALVLLTESLEVVGDSYAIYGFSGMRRSKSELYHVKHLQEPYSDVVRNRIAAMMPMEYTRMGPPIRHLVQKLLALESRVRLLLVISDGKPEDYDDYKGQYAIEDTKKALLEARGLGIHSFCITIDKAAHDYLEYMFGQGNYIFINNIPSLPGRLAELYKKLTSG